MLDAFLDPSCNDGRYVGDVASRTLMAQAHACAARAHYAKFTASSSERLAIQADERRFSRPETMRLGIGQPPLSSLALAAHHANESVKRGLVSPIVLVVGFKMRDLGEALGVNLDQMSRAKKFRPLWRVISRRIDELYAEERRRQSRADARPNQYVCAAEGCGIRGEQRGALKACGGRCPSDIKPSYCSKECQKRVSLATLLVPYPRLSTTCGAGLAEAQGDLQAWIVRQGSRGRGQNQGLGTLRARRV